MQKTETNKRTPRLNLDIRKDTKAERDGNDSFDESCSSSDDFSNFSSDDDFGGSKANIQVMALQGAQEREESPEV